MPTYHYVCPKCDHDFDVFEKKISDRPKTRKCPACGGRARRQISGGAGFLFKGEGFYQTDYRSQEYRSKAKEEKESGGEKKKGTKEKKETGSKSEPSADKSSDTKTE
ncbi:MAG: FmdB family zinc ribbon protein [Gemmatimonadota bacterium]|nr:FmdB family zinc ribbon protein [Gemmatimonadota bacterium]